VVDNASEDGSADMVRGLFPSVNLIANNSNVGFVAANNQASRIARGKYLLIQNSDTEFRREGIEDIIKYLDENKDVGIATAWMEYKDGTFQPPYRRFPSIWNVFATQTIGRLKDKLVPGRSKFKCAGLDPNQIHDVDWVTGAYLFLRRDMLDDGDVFDKDIFMYFEDLLLCLRVKREGFRVVYLPYGSVAHFCGKSAKKVRPKAVLYSYKSSLVYIERLKGCNAVRLYRAATRFSWRLLIALLYPLQLVSRRAVRTKIDLFIFLLAEDNKQ